MIVHPVHKRVAEQGVTLSTNIEWEVVNPNHPDCLWYTFPEQYKDDLSTLSDGFLIPLVSVAMFYREDIHVRGSVSDKLLYFLDNYQSVILFWHPEFFSRIKITVDSVVSSKRSATSGTMCTYTGGVDSTYTLWSHLPQNEKNKEFNITHALYITEMGMHHEPQESIAKKVQSFSALVESLNINFILVETNVKKFQQFGHQTPMYMSDASLILGPVAFFDQIVQTFLFSSDATHDFEILEIIGHTLAPLLATAGMSVVVHGASIPRYEKLRALSCWPAIHNRLVACWKNPNGLKNCGRCYKCCYTMAAIEFENLSGTFTTFPSKIDRTSMRACRAEKGLVHILVKWRRIAVERRKWAIAVDYTWALWTSRLGIFLDDFGLSIILRPQNILYKISAQFRKKSLLYARFIDTLKGGSGSTA